MQVLMYLTGPACDITNYMKNKNVGACQCRWGLQLFTVTAWKNAFLKSSLTFPITIVACQWWDNFVVPHCTTFIDRIWYIIIGLFLVSELYTVATAASLIVSSFHLKFLTTKLKRDEPDKCMLSICTMQIFLWHEICPFNILFNQVIFFSILKEILMDTISVTLSLILHLIFHQFYIFNTKSWKLRYCIYFFQRFDTNSSVFSIVELRLLPKNLTYKLYFA